MNQRFNCPPPAVPLPPVGGDSSPEPEEEGCRNPLPGNKPRGSQGDAVLITFMADGKHVDIARNAEETPLESQIEG